MMRQILILILLSSVCLSSLSQDFRSFIPNDYDTLDDGVARGDLNKDGIEDIVIVVGSKWEQDENWSEKASDSNVAPRLLIILFGTDSGYVQIVKNDKAILCKDCGGIFGDPFAGIEINKNVLSINHYGGSNWRWGYTHKFRFQDKEFFLIGQTKYSFLAVENCEKLNDFAGTKYEDINFVTGHYEMKEISEDCKLPENKKGKRKIEQLISLSNFEIDN
ncbi:MAG TPA: hypothetical protein VK492_14275 [Chitinophagaceae bacterium]|nr:hypothetical protein [Chitinophagaceae bacterium]